MNKNHANPLKPKKSVNKIVLVIISFIIILSLAILISTMQSGKHKSVSYSAFGDKVFGNSSTRRFSIESEEDNVYYLGEYVVNLTQNRKLLFRLSVKSKDDSFDTMVDKSILVQNAILDVFASTGSLHAPGTTKGKKLLKEKIREGINKSIGAESVEEIYFKKYIMQ